MAVYAGAGVKDGLYSITIEMTGIKRGHASGIVVLRGGTILGGDSFFYYSGSYSFGHGRWRGGTGIVTGRCGYKSDESYISSGGIF